MAVYDRRGRLALAERLFLDPRTGGVYFHPDLEIGCGFVLDPPER